ncbi:MAG: hypothetical protein HY876_02205 [Coriobacteriales bacterium]|nr:hypothetical protein [Coriobacteriales bacterium]
MSLNMVLDSEHAVFPTDEAEVSWSEIAGSIELFGADLGVKFDSGAERVRMMTKSGRVLDGDTALNAVVDLWCRTDTSGLGVAVPLQASMVVERIAEGYGRRVMRPGRSRRTLAKAVLDGEAGFAGSTRGGYIFADFTPAYDGVLAVGLIVRMLAKLGVSLDEVVDRLPPVHKVTVQAPCPTERKGAVMRAVSEASAGMRTDLTEGVRIIFDDGWALVLPDSSDAVVHIVAEGPDEPKAAARAAHWAAIVEKAAGGEEPSE